jgi:hypothetical protein
VIAGGGVIEAIALDVLEPRQDCTLLRDQLNTLPLSARRNLRPADGPPSKWPFAFLLLALGPYGLKALSERTHDVGHTLRDWRNLVHPGKARTEPPLSPAEGRAAVAFAEMVVEDVQMWATA